MTVAFYVRSHKEGGTSIIKFGSYDPAGLKNANNMTIHQTVNEKTWAIRMSKAIINDLTSPALQAEGGGFDFLIRFIFT